MRSIYLRASCLVGSAIFFAACQIPAATTGAPARGDDAAVAALHAESAVAADLAVDAVTGQVSALRGLFAVAPTDTVTAARDFLTRHAQAFRVRADLADLRLARHVRDAGGEVLSYAQSHAGVPVVGGELVVGFDPAGAIIHVQSDYIPGLTLSTVAKVPADRARALAAELLATSLDHATVRLVVVRGDKNAPGLHLAYEVQASLDQPRGDWHVFVDAQDGAIVRVQNQLKHTGAPCVPCTPGDAGCGLVLEVDPVSLFNDVSLRDTSNVDAAQRGCVLNNLTSATTLDGLWVNTAITPTRATAPFNYPRSANQQKADEVSVYYHLNRAKEYLNAIGYTGVMSYSIGVNAHSSTLGDNAHYVPSTKILEFGEGGVDDAQDPSVVYHEYGHAIQDNQVPGFGATSEGGAMGEGFGDYWGSALTDQVNATVLGAACVGPWDATAYAPYTGAAGTGCLRRTDGTKQYPRDLDFEVHDDGEIWSSAIWALRQALGADYSDRLIIKSHTLLTSNATFLNGADALLSADQALSGGANAAVLHAAFAARGLPRTATAASSTGLTGTAAYSCVQGTYAALAYKECRFTQPGAQRLRFHFTKFTTEAGYDFAYISDGNYRQVQALAGTPFGSGAGYSAAVTGDTIVLRFKADGSVNKAGFSIDQVQYLAGGCTDTAQCNRCAGETCQAGACVPGAPLNCGDNNPCTSDSCNNATGCVNTAVANGTSCSDGNACNGAETCQAGACAAGTPPNCDDGNACTVDTCNPATGCVNAPVTCNDGNPCTADACDPSTGQCVSAPVADGTSCSDGNVCNGLETCVAGGCTAGTPLSCDDGNACNGAETCHATLGCQAGTPVVCNDGNPCTADACDPSTGQCVSTPVDDGTSCSDGNACNGAETCQAGTCVAGTPLACDDGNACTTDSCNPATGCVNTARDCSTGNVCLVGSCDSASGCLTTPAANGTSCPGGGTCQNGSCAAPTCPTLTGNVSSAARNSYQTLGPRSTGANLQGTLSCPAGIVADVDLELQVFRNNTWRAVASSASATCAELVKYTVPSTYTGLQFRWRVFYYSGASTSYTLLSCG